MNDRKSELKKLLRGPPTCSAGGKEVRISFSEQRNEQFFCGDCGARLLATKPGVYEVMVPRHEVPADVHEFRKKLEREK